MTDSDDDLEWIDNILDRRQASQYGKKRKDKKRHTDFRAADKVTNISQKETYIGPEEAGSIAARVYMMPNKFLQISHALSRHHPVVFIADGADLFELPLCRGTDARNVRPWYMPLYRTNVEPDEHNGLRKPTTFEAHIVLISHRKVFRQNFMGTMSAADLERVRSAVGIGSGREA